MKGKLAMFLISVFSLSFAFLDDDITIYGLELEKVLYFMSALLSLGLLGLTILAYRRRGSRRLLFVSLAFLLFAIKGFLLSSELFVGEIMGLDPLASMLDFGILLSFFMGILKE